MKIDDYETQIHVEGLLDIQSTKGIIETVVPVYPFRPSNLSQILIKTVVFEGHTGLVRSLSTVC